MPAIHANFYNPNPNEKPVVETTAQPAEVLPADPTDLVVAVDVTDD